MSVRQRSLASYQRLSIGHWTGLIREDFASVLGERDPIKLVEDAELVRDRASTAVYARDDERAGMFIKVVQATNDGAAEEPGLIDRLKWALRPSRAVQALRVTRRMARRGIRSAEILLAARRRERGGIVDVIVTRKVEGRSLWEELGGADGVRREWLVREAGRMIGRLHDAHIMHGDCTPQNLLVMEGDALCLVDNDRTRAWPGWLPFVFARRNVAQMTLRLRRLDAGLADVFVEAYGEARGMGAGAVARLRVYAEAKNRERG